jgi:chaperonin GroEL
MGTLNDLAALVGGRPFIQATGNSLRRIQSADLGAARSVWVDRDYVGITGGKGDAMLRQDQVTRLRAQVTLAEDPDQRERLRSRLGKLMGGSAVLWVGGATEREIKQRKLLAENAVETMRGIVQYGILPGGGVSLLRCQPALDAWLGSPADISQRMAHRALSDALSAPARAILSNAGCDPSATLARISAEAPDRGYDVLTGQMVNLLDAGIVESAAAYKAAVQGAINTAAAALTIDVLVHTRNPETVLEPG